VDEEDAVARLLAAQHGVAHVRQLRAAGMTRAQLRDALGRTARYVLPAVVATGTGRLAPAQRLVAASLYAGEGAVISSLTAAQWHGVTAAAGDPRVFVEVPARRGPRGAGPVVVRRTVRPDPCPWERPALLLASRPRAVVQAARDAEPRTARAIVIEAVQRRLVAVGDLRHEVEAGARRGSAVVRRAVQEAEAGAWSVPEADLAALLATSHVLPPAWLNPDLVAGDGTRLPRPDGWFDDVALAVQVHSREFHGGENAFDRTVMVDGVYAEYGVVVVAVTPRLIRDSPGEVLRRVERAHLAAAVLAARDGELLLRARARAACARRARTRAARRGRSPRSRSPGRGRPR
jgi:hypothetical protein